MNPVNPVFRLSARLKNGWRGLPARSGRRPADRNGSGRRRKTGVKMVCRRARRSVRRVAGQDGLVARATQSLVLRQGIRNGAALSAIPIVLALLFATAAAIAQPPAKNAAGLAVTFTSLDQKATDTGKSPNVWLYVAAGESATPFLAPGRFSAEWNGALAVDLRSDYVFQAELNGQLKLEINGQPVLDVSGTGGILPLSKPIQLKKGANTLKAVFTSPAEGDAFVRLGWAEKAGMVSPIPLGSFSHPESAELKKGQQLREGRELFLEHRCAKCHTATLAAAAVPELGMDAPALDGVGARRNSQWMARWILDPKAARSGALMPKLLHGPNATEDAEAIAVYLASHKTGAEVTFDATPGSARAATPSADEGAEPNPDQKPLFERLHCVACHNAPGAEEDTKKLSLKHAVEKFSPGKLAEFLRKPEAHYAWIRMPNFRLNAKEAEELAAYLTKDAVPPKESPSNAALLERGKKLVQTSGCLNCHALKLENQFSTRALADLSKLEQGCLATKTDETSKAPQYAFAERARQALQAFLGTDRVALARHVPGEFAERQTRALNCAGCHGQFDGFPGLDQLGGKLKPEWSAAFLAGEIAYKPRAEKHPAGEPWLEARMPAFKSRASWLAQGMAMEHGYPPRTPAEPPIDMEAAKIGQKLIGLDGGFSCVSCHGVGGFAAQGVFESEGINLGYSGERLLRPFFQRWLRSPISIEPQTKMPTYFDEGRSPLTEYYDGDAEKQISAIWQYIRLGSRMTTPKAD
jgi:mono/diheme cytochrome c family protein